MAYEYDDNRRRGGWRDEDRWEDRWQGAARDDRFRDDLRGGFGGTSYRDNDEVIDPVEARRDWYRDSGRDAPFGEGGYSARRRGPDYNDRGGYRGGQDNGGYRSGGYRSGGHQGSDDRGFFERAGDEMASWFGSEEAERRRRMDAMRGDSGAQHHRGRGPRGYTRSDERIREDINDRLTDDPYIDATEVDVSVSGGEVTLSGTVDHRDAKRRAEDIAESVSGVRHVQNNLRVQQQGQQGMHGTGGTTAGASAMAGMGSGFGSGTGSGSGTETGMGGGMGSGTGTMPVTGANAGGKVTSQS
ncbi:BON domain-containing protein [Azospirillum sp. SYSU D00513]|uniref:BON domain-containing protein n=1 Tax=Azospirillum sp. SYSU D00513 TaxID=2812561 RepID=UPI001A95F594|nr:BON domain-containing protein [Azospirillum sp. SYSU D00513]